MPDHLTTAKGPSMRTGELVTWHRWMAEHAEFVAAHTGDAPGVPFAMARLCPDEFDSWLRERHPEEWQELRQRLGRDVRGVFGAGDELLAAIRAVAEE